MNSARKIVLGITGSIAAVKAVSTARALRDRGFVVRVAMTKSATEVITPQAMRAVSQTAPFVDMWRPDDELGGERHVELAEWGEAILIAPATASSITSLSIGLYDNCVTLVAANFSPKQWFIAPAMAQSMWEQIAIQEHVTRLRSWGTQFLGPQTGPVASGAQGQRLLEPDEIAQAIDNNWNAWIAQ